jgi:hypothetical protein
MSKSRREWAAARTVTSCVKESCLRQRQCSQPNYPQGDPGRDGGIGVDVVEIESDAGEGQALNRMQKMSLWD